MLIVLKAGKDLATLTKQLCICIRLKINWFIACWHLYVLPWDKGSNSSVLSSVVCAHYRTRHTHNETNAFLKFYLSFYAFTIYKRVAKILVYLIVASTGYSFLDRLRNFFTQIYMNWHLNSQVEQIGKIW